MPPTKSPDDLKAILRAMTAKNGAEKDLVGKLVNDIKGVKGLKNEITIG